MATNITPKGMPAGDGNPAAGNATNGSNFPTIQRPGKAGESRPTRRAIATVANCRAPVGAVHELGFDELAGWFDSPTIGAKDGAPWIPAHIEPGPRTGERVKSLSFLALDVEADAEPIKSEDREPLRDQHDDIIKQVIGPEPPGVDDMLAELALRGWQCVLHTSYSHGGSILPEGVEHPRYRLIFDLSRPLEPAELRPLGSFVAGLLGLSDCADMKALEPARLFFRPRRTRKKPCSSRPHFR